MNRGALDSRMKGWGWKLFELKMRNRGTGPKKQLCVLPRVGCSGRGLEGGHRVKRLRKVD